MIDSLLEESDPSSAVLPYNVSFLGPGRTKALAPSLTYPRPARLHFVSRDSPVFRSQYLSCCLDVVFSELGSKKEQFVSDCLVGKRRQEHRQILVVKPAGQAYSGELARAQTLTSWILAIKTSLTGEGCDGWAGRVWGGDRGPSPPPLPSFSSTRYNPLGGKERGETGLSH